MDSARLFISPKVLEVAAANSAHESPINLLCHQVAQLTLRCFPTGFYVSEDAPNTCVDIAASYATGQFVVWMGGSDKTVWGDTLINWCFRAWHDWCHIHVGCALTDDGEAAALAMQKAMLVAIGGTEFGLKVLDAEVSGQAAYFTKFKKFP